MAWYQFEVRLAPDVRAKRQALTADIEFALTGAGVRIGHGTYRITIERIGAWNCKPAEAPKEQVPAEGRA